MVPVSFAPFAFCDQEFALGHGETARALYWVEAQALLVADLHLEKASFFAQTGQMLPPYDTRDTLERLALALRATGARRVFCLGDNFHDAQGPRRLDDHAAGMLAALTRITDWVWITGNHDRAGDGAGAAPVGGTVCDELTVDGVHLRHEALAGETGREISGHFHPRLRVVQRGRAIVRPCVIATARRMVIPAFGTLTGGMDAGAPAIRAALQPSRSACALVPAAGRIARFPLWQEAA